MEKTDKPTIFKLLKSLRIIDKEASGVKINFVEEVILPPRDGEEESTTKMIPHKIDGPFRPRKQMIDSMKKLRKFALELLEIEVDSRDIAHWTVSQIKISGDILKKNSRVVMTLAKFVKATGKMSEIKCGEITMYPTVDDKVKYHKAEEVTAIIEDIVEEVWLYMEGQHDEGDLAVFTRNEEQLQLEFTK